MNLATVVGSVSDVWENKMISTDKRVYGLFCIETLHESRKCKSNGLSCLYE